MKILAKPMAGNWKSNKIRNGNDCTAMGGNENNGNVQKHSQYLHLMSIVRSLVPLFCLSYVSSVNLSVRRPARRDIFLIDYQFSFKKCVYTVYLKGLGTIGGGLA